LHVRAELRPTIGPTVISARTAWGEPDGYRQRFGWSGTVDPTALLAIPAAIDFQRARRWPQVRQRCTELLDETADRLAGLGVTEIADRSLRAPQMGTFRLPAGLDPARLTQIEQELSARHRVVVPFTDVPGLGGTFRVSVAGYTTLGDIDVLVGALETL